MSKSERFDIIKCRDHFQVIDRVNGQIVAEYDELDKAIAVAIKLEELRNPVIAPNTPLDKRGFGV